MKAFAYERAGDAAAAVEAAANGATYLGGGTNLVDLMKLGVAEPQRLVDVSRLPPRRDRGDAARRLRIGAAVRNTDLAAHPLVRERYPAALARRCSPAPPASCATSRPSAATCCSARAAATSRTSRSRATSAAPAPAARRARASTATSRSSATPSTASPPTPRTWRSRWPRSARTSTCSAPTASARSRSPACTGCPATSRSTTPCSTPGDLITAVELGAPAAALDAIARSATGRRFAFAVVSVAAAVELEDGAVTDVRIALGGVAHVPWRAERAEDAAARRASRPRRRSPRRPTPSSRLREPAARQRLQGAAGAQRARPDRSRS